MTQYNPNQPQMYGYAPADPYAQQAARPALKMCRSAAITQIVFGVVIGLMGFCLSIAGMMVAGGGLPPEQQAELGEVMSQIGDAAGVIFIVMGVCVGLPGLLQLILAFFVWKGAKWAIITSAVVDGLFGALMVLNLGSLLMTGMSNPLGACLNVFLLAAVVGMIALLVMGYRESSRTADAQAAYAAQWQQYYQQYQAYQQTQAQQPPQPSQPSAPPVPPADPSNPPPLPPAT